MPDRDAKERGMVAAIMGAKARLGNRGGPHQDDSKADKQAAQKQRKTTITAESFDKQVANKLGDSFGNVFPPTMRMLIEAGLTYEEVKLLLKIPATWGPRFAASSSGCG